MKINAINARRPVYRLIERGTKRHRWSLFRLTLCLGVFSAPALRCQVARSQQALPPDQNVYGTYNIQTDGEWVETISSDQSSRKVRDVWEKSSWQLTYTKKGTENSLKTHVLAWTHELVYTTIFNTGPVGQSKDSTKTEYAYDYSDAPSTLTIKWFTQASGPSYRKILMSEALVMVWTTHTVTRYDRNNKVMPGDALHPNPEITTNRPKFPGDATKPDELRMHLDLPGWDGAKWDTAYKGSFTAKNNYITYKATTSNTYWLTVNAQWDLNP